jgi:serine/threonine-protein kinase
VVHRDVKPANVMLEHSGKVLVLDFGIAKALSADGGTLTASGLVIGSAEYMSPEQAGGFRDIDRRSDVYSLGIVGYEMLAGHTPFDGEDLARMLAKRRAGTAPPDVRGKRADTPPEFARAITRCMLPDRDARWPTAAEAVSAAMP